MTSTKEKIISAATELYAEKDYDGMTMKEIAQKIGVTPPAVYAFFRNKEDLFLHICKHFLQTHIWTSLVNIDVSKPVSKQQFLRMLRGIFEFQINRPLEIKLFMRLLLFPPDVVKKITLDELIKLEQSEFELFRTIFDQAIEKGKIKPGDSKQYTAMLLCLMDGLFWQMQRLEEEDFWERFNLIWGQFWQGITID